jgi:lipopolysaccharide biosynthesis protein
MEKRIFANYLPGFHQDENNNLWWGNGFTEWDNVKNAIPLFKDHSQPKIPSLGYLSLDNKNDIAKQCLLAKEYNISGFIIYNYWYNGKKLLWKPIEVILDNPDIDIEYAICWANHDWTKSWTNRSGALDTLITQNYDVNHNCYLHAKYLSRFFNDKRYLRINDRPILQVYDMCPMSEIYLKELTNILLKNFNFDVLLLQTLRNPNEKKSELTNVNIYFQPSFSLKRDKKFINTIVNFTYKIPQSLKKRLFRLYDLLPESPTSIDYELTCNSVVEEYKNPVPNSILSLFIDFDNTPRYKKRARYFKNFSLNTFEKTLTSCLNLKSFGNLYIINAWNEWGEGMFLEPDKEFGLEKLEIIKKVINENL